MILNQGKLSLTDLSNEFNHRPRYYEHKLSSFYENGTGVVIPNQTTPVASNTVSIPSSGEIKFSDFRMRDGIRRFPITVTPNSTISDYWWQYAKSYFTGVKYLPTDWADEVRHAWNNPTSPLYINNDQWVMSVVLDEYITTFSVYALKDTVFNIRIPSSVHQIRGDYDEQGNNVNDGASIRRPGYILETPYSSQYPTIKTLAAKRSDAVSFESTTTINASIDHLDYVVDVNTLIVDYPEVFQTWSEYTGSEPEEVRFAEFVIRPVCDIMRNDDDAKFVHWNMPSVIVETSRLETPDVMLPTKRGPQTV